MEQKGIVSKLPASKVEVTHHIYISKNCFYKTTMGIDHYSIYKNLMDAKN